jgi:hypothetical protein
MAITIKTILVYVDPKYLLPEERRRFYRHRLQRKKREDMDYYEMCEAVREGKRCTRPTWKDGEYVFSNGKVLIHNTPYWTNEMVNQELKGYPYVVEQVDVVAHDWRICA